MLTDGSQPVGRGIGPALEARDVLCRPAMRAGRAAGLAATSDRARPVRLLELAGAAPRAEERRRPSQALDDGRAWAKFQRICEAQGGMRVPPTVAPTTPACWRSDRDVCRLSTIAGLRGWPSSPAPPTTRRPVSTCTSRSETGSAPGSRFALFMPNSPGELAYAFDYAAANRDIIVIREP